LESVTKDRSNPIAHSTYATLDAILEEVVPKMAAQGLFLTQEPMSVEKDGVQFLGVKTTIWHESGECLKYEPLLLPIEGNARMNISQQAGSVITYAKRYAISAILGISTDEDKDGVQPKNFSEADEPKKELTTEEALEHKIPFGKHKGKTLAELGKNEKEYLRWMLDNSKDEQLKSAIKKVGKHLKEVEGKNE